MFVSLFLPTIQTVSLLRGFGVAASFFRLANKIKTRVINIPAALQHSGSTVSQEALTQEQTNKANIMSDSKSTREAELEELRRQSLAQSNAQRLGR